MFDSTGLHAYFANDTLSSSDDHGAVAATKPMDFVVHKNGLPFAILNATTVRAHATVDGFRRAVPGAVWSLSRA